MTRNQTISTIPAPSLRAFDVWANRMLEKKPLLLPEMEFLDETSNLVTLTPGQKRGCADGVVEAVLAWCTKKQTIQVRILGLVSVVPKFMLNTNYRPNPLFPSSAFEAMDGISPW